LRPIESKEEWSLTFSCADDRFVVITNIDERPRRRQMARRCKVVPGVSHRKRYKVRRESRPKLGGIHLPKSKVERNLQGECTLRTRVRRRSSRTNFEIALGRPLKPVTREARVRAIISPETIRQEQEARRRAELDRLDQMGQGRRPCGW